ncbi:hypothetical protein HDF24_16055 [Mucilaginibacter sp. X4EP1]|uniref:hypothetical protein n=1 Tax=Mucilaginibacter sp. X4EP1 TaxID=2723092 RepID=UPI002167C6E9|nr:hypothetical protein [Mucilaginibacter sp. X4EP1]MCS3814875.1 hypothetical protein [Mucilaginibacter sp. X4EP1]
MPLKLRNRLSGEIINAHFGDFRNGLYAPKVWEIVYLKGAVKIYKPNGAINRIFVGDFDSDEAIDVLHNNPTYFFESVPDIDEISEDNSREKNLDFLSTDRQNKIAETQKHLIITRIKKISLMEWAAIWSIIGAIIALWIYVIDPLIKKYN